MRKKATLYLIILALMLSGFPAATAYAADINVSINEQPVTFTQNTGTPFVDASSRTQVPFRSTMEAFGCTVNWDDINQIAIAEKNGITVEVPIGASYIIKNGQQVPNDTAAQIRDGRTYLPIRAVLEAFGASVAWDPESHSVLVATVPLGPSDTATGTAAGISVDPASLMTIHFIDVGQADSIFIDFGTYEILVDGGNNADGPLVARYIQQYLDGDLDLMIGTHSHEDHIGGLDYILASYPVDRVIYSDETSSTTSFKDFYEAAATEPNCTFTGDSDMTFDMGSGAKFNVIEMGDGYADPNENSVISMIDYNDVEVLLMGDLESSVETANLDKYTDIDVLKVGHHGSRTASSQPFLDVVKPEVSVISAGLDNQYSLPNSDVITRLLSMGSAVYGTFRSGTIVMSTDGSQYTFDTDLMLTPADGGAKKSAGSTAILTSDSNTVTASEALYIGNAGTMKFHTIDCSAGLKISDRNVVYFKTRTEAIDQGYVPCKLCNP
jgi:beta-lactamase superfamily II metal-dependent hydrolase